MDNRNLLNYYFLKIRANFNNHYEIKTIGLYMQFDKFFLLINFLIISN